MLSSRRGSAAPAWLGSWGRRRDEGTSPREGEKPSKKAARGDDNYETEVPYYTAEKNGCRQSELSLTENCLEKAKKGRIGTKFCSS